VHWLYADEDHYDGDDRKDLEHHRECFHSMAILAAQPEVPMTTSAFA
jgi:hypothetical protein